MLMWDLLSRSIAAFQKETYYLNMCANLEKYEEKKLDQLLVILSCYSHIEIHERLMKD
jgi:hypothetical protein